MPRQKKSPKMPVMFYHSITKEDLEKETPTDSSRKLHKPNHNRQKQVWLWSAVSIVMVAVLVFWFTSLPKQLKVSAASSIEKDLFNKGAEQVSNLLEEQRVKTDDLKKLVGDGLKILTTSSTTSTLTVKQVEELKNKLEKK
ncbi:MAG: hypothetical protein NTU97_00735 [Candidatus Magasanikbacteria bacterium]|nr:hypothetical protein [Candidatus Magasanikbacteria bacterium]